MLSLPAEGWEVEGVEGVEDVKYPFIEKGLTLFCMSPFYLNFSFASSPFNRPQADPAFGWFANLWLASSTPSTS